MRLLLLFCSFLLVFPVSGAAGQSRVSLPAGSVRLVEIVEPDSLAAGGVGHFRARVMDGSLQPVNYLWDLGDGTLSIGGLVSHTYSTPGTYTVSVVARSGNSSDTMRTQVRVTPALPGISDTLGVVVAEEEPEGRRARHTVSRRALYGSGGLSMENGGYTWVLATDLWAERARDRMRVYRLQGFRADVYVDTTGRGSPAHRIVVGQFATVGQARAARPWLPPGAVNVWLLELAPPAAPANQR